ncbi:MAG: MATE family efflux transporter [Terrimicrobiaceae bacterium]
MLRSILSENRRTLALAVPIIAGHLGQMLMGWVDAIMVGRVGVVELGACGFANTLLSVPLVFGFGLFSAVSVRVSHSHGGGRTAEAGECVRGGFVVAFLLAIPVILGLYGILPHIGIFGQPEAVNSAVGGYLIISAWSLLPVFFTCVSKNFCEALGHPWQPFWIMLAGVSLNAFLNWILIFGNWGAPAMGLEGAAVATLLARIAVMVGVFAYPALSRSLRAAWPTEWFAAGAGDSMRGILRTGLPAGGLHLCEVSGFAVGSLMMGWIGVIPLAAHQIAMTCAATTFMVPLGLSQAACVRVGHARGAGRVERLRPIIFGALSVAVLFMSVFVLVFIIFGKTIASWFVTDPAVVLLTSQLLLVAGIFQIFDGIQVVSAGVLRGFEDTRVPMSIGILSYWIVALPFSWLVGFVLGGGALGVWFGFVVGLAVAAAALLWRVFWRMGKLTKSVRA